MEKLANHIALQNIAEGGMEKQALNLGQLMRMAKTFASRGKLNRFDDLLYKRQRALHKVYGSRLQQVNDAAVAANMERKLTQSFGPAAREAARLKNRIPGGSVNTPDWRLLDLDRGITNPNTTKYLLSHPAPASIQGGIGGLNNLMGDISRHQPAVLDDVLKNLN